MELQPQGRFGGGVALQPAAEVTGSLLQPGGRPAQGDRSGLQAIHMRLQVQGRSLPHGQRRAGGRAGLDIHPGQRGARPEFGSESRAQEPAT